MRPTFNLLKSKFRDLFSIDLRALAAFRIVLGTTILIYLGPKFLNLYAFYTDSGILPRNSFFELINPSFISIHLASGNYWFQVFLFAIQLFFALSLIVGYRSRLSTVVSWFLLVSLQNRNPLVLNYGDQLFRMLLFWGMLLPLGKKWSLDSIWQVNEQIKKNTWLSVATVAVLLQMFLFYIINWFLKDSFEWKGIFAQTHNVLDLFNYNRGFTAVEYSMQVNYIVTPFGYYLLDYPVLMKLGTIVYIYFQFLGPLLLFSPIFTKKLRYLSLFVFFTYVHGMLSLMLYAGLFQLFCYAGLLLFLPSSFWDFLEKRAVKSKQTLKIYYDNSCEFCKTGVCILGKTNNLKLSAIQDNKEIYDLDPAMNSIVVEDETGQKYFKIDAFIKIFENKLLTRWLAWLLKIKPLYSLGTKIYAIIARERHKISNFINYIKPREVYSRFGELLAQGFAITCLVLVLFWNIGNVIKKDFFADKFFSQTVYTLRLDQYWGMFASRPTSVSSWLVIPGVLVDGTKVDVMSKTVGEPSFSRQTETPWRFWSQSWRNYLLEYPANSDKSLYTKLFSDFLCREWNDTLENSNKKLSSFKIHSIEQKTLIGAEAVPEERYSIEFHCNNI